MSSIRLVTFDVTNTIIRVVGNVGHNYAQAAAVYNKTVDPVKLDNAFPKVYKHHSNMYPNFGVHNGLTTNKWWNMVVEETFREAGCDDANVDKIAQHLFVHFASGKGWEILPEAVSTLTKLAERGVTIGVVSNFDERLERILTHLALRHFFKFVICSAVVKCQKPNEDIFKLALKAGNCKPEAALHIGDNVFTDYEGATKAGMKAVLYWNKSKAVPETVNSNNVVHNLSDVLHFL